jgi:organic hydroperoxide reductase OsmC/OhrA
MEPTQFESPAKTVKMFKEPNGPQSKDVLYTAKDHTTDGRDGGSSHSRDGRLEIKFSLPGTTGTGTNLEQLSPPVGRPVLSAP